MYHTIPAILAVQAVLAYLLILCLAAVLLPSMLLEWMHIASCSVQEMSRTSLDSVFFLRLLQL